MRYRPSRRTRRFAIGTAAVAVLAGTNGPALYRFGADKYHDYQINRPAYKADMGHWQRVNIPKQFRLNTIHAALLHTGKVLLIAGSGNNTTNFAHKDFRSVLWDPARNTFKNIPTPNDIFCAGHVQLPDGKLLIAGGTRRYETLKGDVKKAGGLMFVHNENPDSSKLLPTGTRFTGRESGITFESKDPVRVPPARKFVNHRTGKISILRSTVRVYVEALHDGRKYQTGTQDQYRIAGLRGKERQNVYGIAQKLSFDKKDFQGIPDAYEFDPRTERYVKVHSMHEARWYPTLTLLPDGRVLAVSGLDDIGQVVPGKNEIFDPTTKRWTYLPTRRFFPTYPALFLADRGRIFYTGSNAGYGPDDVGRTPGVWHLGSNRFDVVPGISAPDILETSMSVLLPPAQDQRYMVMGGGGVGESTKSTARTRITDLHAARPHFTDGPDLYARVRYPSAVVLPDDTVLITDGSRGYRGRSDSNVLKAEVYDPRTNSMHPVADPLTGRNYHSGALLLPDGRVMTFGSDSLFGNKANTIPGTFQQDVDIYTPSYLYRGARPRLTDTAPRTVRLGGRFGYHTPDPSRIRAMRLIRPGSFTHVTDVEQRSIALDFTRTRDGVRATVPHDPSLVPPGWYMVMAVDRQGRPSQAAWLRVPVEAGAGR